MLRRAALPLLCVVALVLAACSPIRPVLKVGLLAPFEGLYREDGYAALRGLRLALEECTPPDLAAIPLALDDGADPAQAIRSAQKLLIDPAAGPILGPLSSAAVAATHPYLAARTWITPYHLHPTLGLSPDLDAAWLAALVDAVHATVAVDHIVVAGVPDAFPIPPAGELTVLPEPEHMDAHTQVPPGAAILWLGDPAHGAAWFATLRAQSDTPFFLGTPYGAGVFAAHAPRGEAAYWLVWRDFEYNPWAEKHAPAQVPAQSFPAYYTYRAACHALADYAGRPIPASLWQVEVLLIPIPK